MSSDCFVEHIIKFYNLLKCRNFKIIRLFLDERTDNISQKINSQACSINNEIDKFNDMEIKKRDKFCKWKKRLKGMNEVNVLLIKEASKLIFKLQQKMYVLVLKIITVAFLQVFFNYFVFRF